MFFWEILCDLDSAFRGSILKSQLEQIRSPETQGEQGIMKNRSRALSAAAASLLALSAAGFGFSKWSSDLNLNGNVTAKGSWDVQIQEAAATRLSTGASSAGAASEVAPTYEFTVYDLRAVTVDAEKFPYVGDVYRVQLDDTNPHKVSMTQEEYDEYTTYLNIGNANPKGYSFFKSGILGPDSNKSACTVQANLNELGTSLGYSSASGISRPNEDNGASNGQIIGTCIVNTLYRSSVNPWNLVLSYEEGGDYLETATSTWIYKADVAEDGQSAVYSDVNLGLPGAWAEYSVTLVNNGTANANLSDYSLALSETSDLLTLDAPVIGEDEVLKPGETCTLTFTVSVSEDAPETIDEVNSLSVHLVYEQDAVEEKPESSHVY